MDKRRVLRAAGLLIGLGAAFLLLYRLGTPCLVTRLTGITCAGCGTQRMFSALLRGDMAGAFRQNPFMFILLPLAGCYLLWECGHYIRGKSPLYARRGFTWALAAVLALAAAFTLLRNLPGFTFLGPF